MRSFTLHLFIAVMLTYMCVEGSFLGGPGSPQVDDKRIELNKSEKDKRKEQNDEPNETSAGKRIFIDFQEGNNKVMKGRAHDEEDDEEGPVLKVHLNELGSAKKWFEEGDFQRQAMKQMQKHRNGARFDGKYVLLSKNTKYDAPGSEGYGIKKAMTRNLGYLVQGVIVYAGKRGGWETARASGDGGWTEWLGQPRRSKYAVKNAITSVKKFFGNRLKWDDLFNPGKYVEGSYDGEDHKFKTDERQRYFFRLWKPYCSFDMVLTPAPEWKELSQFWPMIEYQKWQMEQQQQNQRFEQAGFSQSNPMGNQLSNQMGLNNPYNSLGGSSSFGGPSSPYNQGTGTGSFGAPAQQGGLAQDGVNHSPLSSGAYDSQKPGTDPGTKFGNEGGVNKRVRRKAKRRTQATPTAAEPATDSASSVATNTVLTEQGVSGNPVPMPQQQQQQYAPQQQQQQYVPQQQQQMQQQVPVSQGQYQQQQPMQYQQQQQPMQQQQQMQQGKEYETDDYWMPESDPNHVNMPDTVRTESMLETEVGSNAQAALLPRLVTQGKEWTTKHQEWLLHGTFLCVGLLFGYAGRGVTNDKRGVYAKLLDEV